MSRAAARHAARTLGAAVSAQGRARIVAATGASQFDFLDALTAMPDIDWTRVEMFHLDEYVGLAIDHPASFRRYLRERLISKTGITRYHFLDGEHRCGARRRRRWQRAGISADRRRLRRDRRERPSRLQRSAGRFRDRAAVCDRHARRACRQQQVGEGWFASVADVPSQAISMSVRQILKSREIICVVPGRAKGGGGEACVDGEVSPMAPASILRTHPNTTLYLDRESAACSTRRLAARMLASSDP